MKITFILGILFISPSLLADCSIKVGKKYVTLKEKESRSLFASEKEIEENEKKGKAFKNPKPLKNFTGQDQDGLATCYANATSVALKTVLPDNPDISYAHLALKGSAHGFDGKKLAWDKEQGKYMKDKVVKEDGKEHTLSQSMVNYGNVCEAIQGAKNAGGACKKKGSFFENGDFGDPQIQQRLYEGLGKYFDKLNEVKADPNKYGAFENDLNKVVDTFRSFKSTVKNECEDKKKAKFPVQDALAKNLSQVYLQARFDTGECANSKVAAISKLVNSESILKSDRAYLYMKPESVSAFDAEVMADKELAAELEAYLSAADIPFDKTDALAPKVQAKFEAVLRKLIPASDLKGCEAEANPLLSPNTQGMAVLSNITNAKRDKCDSLFQPVWFDPVEYKSRLQKSLGCTPNSQMQEILDAIMPLVEMGVEIDDKIVNALKNKVTGHASQIEALLMPGCSDPANKVPLDDITCESISFCNPNYNVDQESNKYNGPPLTEAMKKKGNDTICYKPDHGQQVFADEVVGGILEGRATPISVCTSFMIDPKSSTTHCNIPQPGIEGHGLHAMTVSGVRCMNGKLEYEVVNSWGADACPVDETDKKEKINMNKNKILECQTENDNRNGRMWIKAGPLIDHTTHISPIKNKAKK